MIKFAVTRPKQRLEAINHGVQMLKWHQDPILNHFGMKIESEMTIVSIFRLTYLDVTNFFSHKLAFFRIPRFVTLAVRKSIQALLVDGISVARSSGCPTLFRSSLGV